MNPASPATPVAPSSSVRAAIRQALGATVALLLLSPAQAQDSPAPESAQAEEATGLEEIVVTARKRDEALLDTPRRCAAH